MNISRTGLLFETDRSPAVGTSSAPPTKPRRTIEVLVEFPPPLAKVLCFGRIVRVSMWKPPSSAVAVSIDRYRLKVQ